jgi:hypothetical protein
MFHSYVIHERLGHLRGRHLAAEMLLQHKAELGAWSCPQLMRIDHRPSNIRTRVPTLLERTARVICDNDFFYLFETEVTMV